jgi:hypothetical protein
MGASGWSYFVPYQADINQALQELRQQTFDSGRYYKPAEFYERISSVQPDELRAYLDDKVNALRALAKPRTIDELVAQNGEDGTHSIIDITGISLEPGFGTASPLAEQQLLDLFGTLQPSQAMIIQQLSPDMLPKLRRRWQALYIITFDAGQPQEIFFCGFSGD